MHDKYLMKYFTPNTVQEQQKKVYQNKIKPRKIFWTASLERYTSIQTATQKFFSKTSHKLNIYIEMIKLHFNGLVIILIYKKLPKA